MILLYPSQLWNFSYWVVHIKGFKFSQRNVHWRLIEVFFPESERESHNIKTASMASATASMVSATHTTTQVSLSRSQNDPELRSEFHQRTLLSGLAESHGKTSMLTTLKWTSPFYHLKNVLRLLWHWPPRGNIGLQGRKKTLAFFYWLNYWHFLISTVPAVLRLILYW